MQQVLSIASLGEGRGWLLARRVPVSPEPRCLVGTLGFLGARCYGWVNATVLVPVGSCSIPAGSW